MKVLLRGAACQREGFFLRNVFFAIFNLFLLRKFSGFLKVSQVNWLIKAILSQTSPLPSSHFLFSSDALLRKQSLYQ